MIALHWFRRDLRLTDNTALNAAVKSGSDVVPVYVASDWRGNHTWTGPARQEFLCGCLASLARNIEAIGGRLIFRRGCAIEELEKLARETRAEAIYFNRDPDPFGREMEGRIRRMAEKLGIKAQGFKDVAIHERDELITGAGGPYRVFTPYATAWMKLEKPPAGSTIRKLSAPAGISSLPLPVLADWGLKRSAEAGGAGERAARKRLADFLRGPIFTYATNRNIPAGRTTSRLSADLRHGTISIRDVYHKCVDLAREAEAAQRRSIFTFINELVWREFYMQILWHHPEVLKVEFNPKHRHLKWRGAGESFERWRRAKPDSPSWMPACGNSPPPG